MLSAFNMFFFFFFLLPMKHWTSGMQSSTPPIVEMRMLPAGPILEEDGMNVTLHCDLLEGNPLELTTVYWFMNREFIRQLPDPQCADIDDLYAEYDTDELGNSELGYVYSKMVNLCDVDPSQLFLQQATREFSGNFSCSGRNIAGEGQQSESVELNVLYLPGQAVLSQEWNGWLVTLLCSVEDQGNPAAEEFIWKRELEYLGITTRKLILENLSTADSGANVSCAAASDLGTGERGYLQLTPPAMVLTLPRVSTKHGDIVAEDRNDALHRPECSIHFAIEDEEIVLLCKAKKNTKDVKFWWEKNNVTFDGQTGEESLESKVRLKLMNESAGTYLCHMRDSVGQEQSCMIDLTEGMMTPGLSEEVILITIVVVCAVIILLIIIIISVCFCYQEKEDKEERDKMRKNKSKLALINDDKDSIASSFYDNLPFEGLQSPPKQIVDDASPDLLDYADDDDLDTNAEGPIKYRQTSEKNATIRRQKIEERKSILL